MIVKKWCEENIEMFRSPDERIETLKIESFANEKEKLI